MKRLLFAAFLLAIFVVNVSLAQSPRTMTVVRDPGCMCCEKWVAHMEQAGFKTTLRESAERRSETKGVPDAARSCHTGTVDGYLIEGHVPAEDIKRLLKERPSIAGLAAPGMPIGSPGMESPSGTITPYDVVAFDKSGRTRLFASHR